MAGFDKSEKGANIASIAMKKVPFKDKKRLQIFVSEEEREKIRINAVKRNQSVSEFLATAGTINVSSAIRKKRGGTIATMKSVNINYPLHCTHENTKS